MFGPLLGADAPIRPPRPGTCADKDTRLHASSRPDQIIPCWSVGCFDVAANSLVELMQIWGVGAPRPESLQPIDARSSTRYRQSDLRCTLDCLRSDVAAVRTGRVTLSEPARAVTPGQYCRLFTASGPLSRGASSRDDSIHAMGASRPRNHYNSQLFPCSGHGTDISRSRTSLEVWTEHY